MTRRFGCATALALFLGWPAFAIADDRREAVVVLHGLARKPDSMNALGDRLDAAGYVVHNVGYPSTKAPPEELVALLRRNVRDCCQQAEKLHFVTHSLGGILTRAYLAESPPENLGRVVMLAPPNHGSEIVDLLGGIRIFNRFFGPTARQLGTSGDSLPNRLPEPFYEVGIIAGNRPINPLGAMVIPGADDGAVSVDGAKLRSMADFIEVHQSHSFIMRSREVARQVVNFLRDGRFDREPPSGS